MEWWQKALFSFGEKGGNSRKCIICKDCQFSNEDEVQEHLKQHNLEEFERLKFEVKVKGFKGDAWDTLSESVISVALDNTEQNMRESTDGIGDNTTTTETSKEPATNEGLMDGFMEEDEEVKTDEVQDRNESDTTNSLDYSKDAGSSSEQLDVLKVGKTQPSESAPLTRKSSRARKRISLEDFESDVYNRKDNSFKHLGKSMKKTKVEKTQCENDPDVEVKAKKDTCICNLSAEKEGPLPRKSSPTIVKKRGRPRKIKAETDTSQEIPQPSQKKSNLFVTIDARNRLKHSSINVDRADASSEKSQITTTSVKNSAIPVPYSKLSSSKEKLKKESTENQEEQTPSSAESRSPETPLDVCERGPDEKDAIEVLMSRLGKSVRHEQEVQQNQMNECDVSKIHTPKTTKTPRKRKASVKVRVKKSNQLVFACDSCEWETSEHRSFHKHLLIHSNGQPTRCWYCDESIDRDAVTQDTHEFKCEVCEETFTQNFQLAVHIRDTGHHFTSKNFTSVISLQFTCFLCSLSVVSAEELDIHLNCVHFDEICDKTPEELEELKKSKKPSGPIGRADMSDLSHFVCHICSWKSGRHFNFHRHMLTHTLGKNYQCTYCYKVICAENSKTGYGQIVHECIDCQQVFHTKLKYKIHRFDVHGETSAGSRQCRICGFVARSKRDISKHHMLAHGTEKFDNQQVNVINDKIDTKVNKAVNICDVCGFASDRKNVVEKHRLTHIPPEQRDVYKCNQCEFSSYVMSSVNMHISTKHKQKVSCEKVLYKCDLCVEYTGLTKEGLLKHKAHCIKLFEEDNRDKEVAASNEENEKTECSPETSQAQFAKSEAEVEKSEAQVGKSEAQVERIQAQVERSETQVEKSEAQVEKSETQSRKSPHTSEESDEEMADKNNISSSDIISHPRKRKGDFEKFRFVCDLCELVFTRMWNLKRHKEMRHDRTEYNCPLCEYVTKNLKYLYRHYDVAHSMGVELPKAETLLKEGHSEGTEGSTNRKLALPPIKKKAVVSTNEKINCKFCGMELTEVTMKPHVQRKHMQLYKCAFHDCPFSAIAVDEVKTHVIQNHLQVHPMAALDVLNELCSKSVDNLMSPQPTNFAVLMCAGCCYRALSVDEMITHKAIGAEVCGSVVLKMDETHPVPPCSHCGFTAKNDKQFILHQTERCVGADLYDINELIEENQGSLYQLMDMVEPTQPANTSPLYQVNFVNQRHEATRTESSGNPPSYTEAVSQKITTDNMAMIHSTDEIPSISQQVTGGNLQGITQMPENESKAAQNAQNARPLFDQSILKKSIGVTFDTTSYSTDIQLKEIGASNRIRTNGPSGNELIFIAKTGMLQQYGQLITENSDLSENEKGTTTHGNDPNEKKENVVDLGYMDIQTESRQYNAEFVRRLFDDSSETNGNGGNLEDMSTFDNHTNDTVQFPRPEHSDVMETMVPVQDIDGKTKVIDDSESEQKTGKGKNVISQNLGKNRLEDDIDDSRGGNSRKTDTDKKYEERSPTESETQQQANLLYSRQLTYESPNSIEQEPEPEKLGQSTDSKLVKDLDESLVKSQIQNIARTSTSQQDGTESVNLGLGEDNGDSLDCQRSVIVDKKSDDLTLITVPNGENDISLEIRGRLNVNADGALPSNLYSFISQVLEKQRENGPSSNVVYCDIIVDNDD